MKPAGAVQVRYQALHDGFSPLVTALILAALAGAKAGIEFDDRGNLKPFDVDKVSPEQKDVIAQIGKANQEFADGVMEMMTATAQFITATQALPRTLNEATVQVAAFQLDYESAAERAQTAAEVWRSLDVQSSRTRVAVAERLQKEGGISATAADKAASGDPEYTSLKDQIAVALNEKERAEIERDVCLSKLLSARAILAAQVQMSVARIGAPTVVIREAATKASGEEPSRDGGESAEGGAGATSQAAQG